MILESLMKWGTLKDLDLSVIIMINGKKNPGQIALAFGYHLFGDKCILFKVKLKKKKMAHQK